MRDSLQCVAMLILCLVVVSAVLHLCGCDSDDGDASGDIDVPESADPTAAFTVTPASGTTATSFTFDASQSSDPETVQSALQVRWDWDGDGTYDTAFTATKTATHQFATPGSHRVTLQVRDSYDATDTVTKTVTVVAP